MAKVTVATHVEKKMVTTEVDVPTFTLVLNKAEAQALLDVLGPASKGFSVYQELVHLDELK